jgi:hypothetical protein
MLDEPVKSVHAQAGLVQLTVSESTMTQNAGEEVEV